MSLPVVVKITQQDRSRALVRAEAMLPRQLARLAALPKHGNCKLTSDQLFLALLLSFFDTMARSLRRIEDQGDFQGRLNLARLARSTTSDALTACDPKVLLPVIQDLRERTPNLKRADASLETIARRIVASDGTYLNTLANVAFALKHTKRNGKSQAQVRANFQMDVDTWAPQVVSVSGDDDQSEPAAFARDLLRGVLYVFDRNFLDFRFIEQVLEKENDFVLRARANAPAVRVIEPRPLTADDIEAGVIRDELVELTGRDAPRGVFRQVTIGAVNRHGKEEIVRLLTNLTDASACAAHVIGAVYRLRWQIELFFKWFKTFARLNHLLSTSRNGITYQLYVAVIGVLMMVVQSGRRISIYALAVLSHVAAGTMSLSNALAVIEKRNREREMERARRARLRAAKKPV
jgi:hypothetical protein